MPDKPPRPLHLDELVTQLEPREPSRSAEELSFQVSVMLAATEQPQVDLSMAEVKEGNEGQTHEVRNEGQTYEVKLSVSGATLGKHAFPPAIEARRFEPEKDIRERQNEWPEFEGYLPDHLPLRPIPKHLPSELVVPRRVKSATLPERPEDVHQATTVFSPDDRFTFNDTTYPWSTTGRVETPGGQASGAMVGPRHLLTCSHTIQWNADGTTGWIKFTPAYFDGSAPFGVAWGTTVYWEGVQVVGPDIDTNEGQHDYVAVVLDTRIGDLTGWMGSRSWSDDWDGESLWSHVGYPGDLAGGQRPSYQGSIALNGSYWDTEDHSRIFHQGDVWPGQSGGPFFAWWDGESWPRVVADQSGQTSDENSASGGAHMIDCVNRALNDFP